MCKTHMHRKQLFLKKKLKKIKAGVELQNLEEAKGSVHVQGQLE